MVKPPPINFGPRICWWCKKKLVKKVSNAGGESQEHCDSPGCSWCKSCEKKRKDGILI